MAIRKVFPERWVVYRITNIVNGKLYIGVTSYSMAHRWAVHVCSAIGNQKRKVKDRFLWMAIRKYGPEAFTMTELEEVLTREEAMAIEKRYIATCGTMAPNGYNMTIGGEGVFPRPPMSAEQRAKISVTSRGRRHSLATRTKLSELWMGRKRGPLTAEQRAKISARQQGQKRGPHTPETRAKIAAAHQGRKTGPQTTEHRTKISSALKGLKRGPFTPEHRAKLSVARRKHLEKLTQPVLAVAEVAAVVQTEAAPLPQG